MGVEIEAKMKVENFDGVRARLRESGARSAGTVFEINTFFDTEDRSLLAGDEGLRLRQLHDLASGEMTLVATYKGPRNRGMLKSREEIELNVGSWDNAVQLFSKLGFNVVLSFEKRRETWEFGGCKVELDELPHLGTYVEIEGPAEGDVLKVRETLGLADRNLLKASYAALLAEHAQEHGKGSNTLRFGEKPTA